MTRLTASLTRGLAASLAAAWSVAMLHGAHAQDAPPGTQQAPGGGPAAAQSGIPNTGFATGPAQQIATPGLGPLFGSPFGDDHLFGDWGGARTWLQDHGIGVDLDYLTENAGNVTGGRRQGFETSGQVGLEIDLDLAKLVGIPNAALHTMTVQREGTNLSSNSIGDDLATVQEIYGGGGNVIAHLVYAYYEQTLFDNRLDLAGGWLPVGTYFASSPLYCDFMNVLFCGNPHPLPTTSGEPDWPQATFGGQARFLITPDVYLQAGVFSVDPDFGTGGGGISGFAWADSKKSGVSIPVEAGWAPQFGPDHLIGHYKIGFDQDTNHYPDVLNNDQGVPVALAGGAYAPRKRQQYYVLIDQMLVRQGKGDTAGVIAFGGWVHADDDVTPFAQQAFAGLVSTGTPWGRPKDVLGVAFHWLELSGQFTRAEEIAEELGGTAPFDVDGYGTAYGPQNTEQVVELSYGINVFRGITLMPDFQYIIRPGATTATPDAAVLGFRTNINF